MHPDIRKFPSDTFYGGLISDHESVNMRDWKNTIFKKRVVFFDLIDNKEEQHEL